MTYSVLKVPLNPNQPTNLFFSLSLLKNYIIQSVSYKRVCLVFSVHEVKAWILLYQKQQVDQWACWVREPEWRPRASASDHLLC